MSQISVMSVVGARPQFIKAAAVSRAFGRDPRFSERIIHTGQHYDKNMSNVFFEELGIPTPSYHFRFGGLGHAEMTGEMLKAIEGVLLSEAPDALVIYGDTNSTLAGALAASKIHIPVVHIEAGLRSYNKTMPEEINRILSDHVSSLLLCPTQTAADNLAVEGITSGVHVVGDVMYDASLFAGKKAGDAKLMTKKLGLDEGRYGLCTLHRQENTDDPERFERILRLIEEQAMSMTIVMPLHPRTRSRLKSSKRELKGILATDPIGYFDLQALLKGASLVLTDSGGLQKEAYFHRVPCVTLRDETEWVETVEAGWNRLWTQEEYIVPRREISQYGDGDAAEICVDLIGKFLR